MNNLIISPRQIRAARGLIGWSQTDLAKAANISRSTIAAIENGSGNPTVDMMSRIRTVFEAKQVEFLTQEGVRFREPTILYDDAPGANRRLLDDVFAVAQAYHQKSGLNDILIYGLREDDAQYSVGDYLSEHIDRLQSIGLSEKILCAPSTKTYVAPQSWYRRLPERTEQNLLLPVMVYGDKLAVVQWHPQESVVIVDSKPMADAFRAMFQHIWSSVRGDK